MPRGLQRGTGVSWSSDEVSGAEAEREVLRKEVLPAHLKMFCWKYSSRGSPETFSTMRVSQSFE